ncbi:hypothetical protein NG697_12445 [Pseudarthrobacter sp. MDT3-26]|uniref:hypothetical protein n=1 Tax=Pseudarthrobacter raffinosi TaxID=2953651 RepID=UPI00208FBF7F|nr:hypothetical protein [Pseudarthrobacter sp. MDT3-26]MCO4263721.1 hypothetical protein [Pseudarthrobacter sp. MDT3-26]
METQPRVRAAYRTRTVPTSQRQVSRMVLAVPEPFNPYTLPVGRTAIEWAHWGARALVLSIVATLIWDRGTMIRHETRGQITPLAAPAQWASAAVLSLGSLAAAFLLGMPWGAIPLAFGAAVMTRRVLAAGGMELTVEGATYQPIGKVVLAGLGIGAWWGSIFLGGLVQSLTSSLTSNPVAKMAGESSVAAMKKQTTGIADTILSAGSLVGGVLVLIAALWWARTTYLAATSQEAAAVSEQTIDAEETENV